MNEAQLRSIVTPHNFVLPHNTKHVHTPSLRLTARSPNYIKVLPPITKKRTSECKVLKTTLSLSLHTFIHIIYMCIFVYICLYFRYFHPFTNDPTSHHRFTLDFALYSPQHNYLTGLRTGSCGTPRLVLH